MDYSSMAKSVTRSQPNRAAETKLKAKRPTNKQQVTVAAVTWQNISRKETENPLKNTVIFKTRLVCPNCLRPENGSKLLFLLVLFQILCGGLWVQNAKYNNYRIFEAFGFLQWNRALMKQRWLQATVSLTEQMFANLKLLKIEKVCLCDT